MPIEVRKLGPDDLEPVMRLRREALETSPLAFKSSPEDDRLLTPELAREVLEESGDKAVLGLLDGEELVGMVGVLREPKVKRRHRAHVWGTYVAAHARGRGAGRRLIEAAIAVARSWPGVEQVALGVSDTAPEARRLYESCGFRPWGHEPRSLVWEGRSADEIHLILDLDRDPA